MTSFSDRLADVEAVGSGRGQEEASIFDVVTTWNYSKLEGGGEDGGGGGPELLGVGSSTSSLVLVMLVNLLDVYILPAIVIIGIACNLTAIAVYVSTPRVSLDLS